VDRLKVLSTQSCEETDENHENCNSDEIRISPGLQRYRYTNMLGWDSELHAYRL